MICSHFPDKKNMKSINTNGIPAEARSQYRRASELLHQGKTEDALHCFQKAAEIAPDYAEALHETGNCLHDLGRHGEACAYYSRALQNIGDRLYEIGRYEESVGHYWIAIRRYEEASKYLQPEFSPDPSNKGTQTGEKPDEKNGYPDHVVSH